MPRGNEFSTTWTSESSKRIRQLLLLVFVAFAGGGLVIFSQIIGSRALFVVGIAATALAICAAFVLMAMNIYRLIRARY
jgi:hypothetical protein